MMMMISASGLFKQRAGVTLSDRSLQDPIIVTENKSEEHG